MGKIILNNNDTVNGFITYYDDFSSTVTYSDSTNNTNSCTIDCINEIILDNGYIFTTIDYDDGEDGSIFVQKIIESKLISLYASEENGSVYYYVSKDNIAYKLENSEITTEGNNNKRYRYFDKKYIGIFKMVMSDKPELFDKIDNLKFTKNNMMNIVLEYNKGNVSYIMPTIITRSKSNANTVIFGQYNNFGNFYHAELTSGLSYGIFGGIQIYFSRNRRHSFKFPLGYSHYALEYDKMGPNGITYTKNEFADVISIGVTYEYIMFMTKRINIYTQINIGEFSFVTKKYEDGNDEIFVSPIPRLSPGIGLEYKTKKRLSFFAEINNILIFKAFPINFSAGVRYDVGKITGNIL